MKFEELPNELLLDLFEFCDPIQLIRSFQHLNTRFNQLLFVRFCSYRLDFRSISKANFHLMCEEYLPLIIDNVSSLCLSDGEETPQLSQHLIPYCLTLDEFTRLRSLLIQNIDTPSTLLNITLDCFYLPYLTHLKFIKCHFTSNTSPNELFVNIWNLKQLTHCTLDIIFEHAFNSATFSIISKSIEYLSIKNFTFSSTELAYLLHSVPSLRHLFIKFGQPINTELFRLPSVELLTSLKIYFDGSVCSLTHILKSMPNLLYLTFETETINLNGNQWKQILIDYVPQIKRFRFLMKVLSIKNNNVEEQLDDVLNTFRTPFWLDEHQWFVRCDWPQHSKKLFLLYTLPYCFGDIHVIHQNQWSKTTGPNTCDYNSYDRVMNVFYNGRIGNLTLSPIVYPNVRHLTLRVSVDNYFWTIIPTLDHLLSLEIIEIRGNSQSKSYLKVLLNRAPRLKYLSIDPTSCLQLVQMNISHPSLCRIRLKSYCTRMNRYLNAEQCSILANSLLGRQCEVLTIRIDDRSIILDLVRNMCNLRALNCECQNEFWFNHLTFSSDDELVAWLRSSFPDKYSISRHRSCLVQLWISR
ncbi:unnamed protein product [Rotaria magnacalcarata]